MIHRVGMFIRYYIELSQPVATVQQALVDSPTGWLSTMAREAQARGDGLLGEVGVGPLGARLRRQVRIRLGEPVQFPSMTSLPLTWEPVGLEGVLPRLDANLELGSLGEGRTQLAISARYRPPLGVVGRAVDRVLLHRVAEATLKDFLDRLGQAITEQAITAGVPQVVGHKGDIEAHAPCYGNPTRLSPSSEPWHDVVMSAPPLRVMLVDDHEVVRDGIRLLLNQAEDVVVCAEASSTREAVAVAASALPDVIVMDVRLSDGSGIEATRDIRAARPQTAVLMLTSFADDEALFASIMAGAAGYVLKQIRGDELVRAIRAVGAGQNLLDPAVTKGVFDRLRRGKHLLRDEKLARLSPQEERILAQVADGRTNGQIAADLGLAEKTVKNYVSSILSKLEVARRAEAAAYLARHTTLPGA